MKKTRDSQREQVPPDAELSESERAELIRLRAESKDEPTGSTRHWPSRRRSGRRPATGN